MSDEVYHCFHHCILFVGSALGNEEREGHARGGNALVAVAEAMVLRDKIEKHGGFLLDRRIELLSAESLIDLPDAALEAVILLVGKQSAAAELLRSSASTRMAPSYVAWNFSSVSLSGIVSRW